MVPEAAPSYIPGMMTLAIHDQRLAKPGPQNAALRDYDSVRRAIAFISEHWRTQPTIEAMADAAGVTPDELHHLFRRWAGLTPKAFMQALTLDHAKGLLRDSASILDAALDSGLSGPGRLHDLFVTHEAMSPGEWKNGGGGLTLRYGLTPSKDLWLWFMSAVKGKVERRNVSIVLLDADGVTEALRWNLINAWVREWRGALLDALGHEAAIESVTLVFESLERG